MNIVIGDYNINIKRNPVLNRLKDIDYYKKIPDLFLETYTDLSEEDIYDIVENKELSSLIVETIYKNLNIDDEKRFIKVVNNSSQLLNSIDGILIIFLERYYGHNLLELIKMTSEELLTLFVFNLKIKNPDITLHEDTIREVLNDFYSKETVEDFIESCCDRIKQDAQRAFEDEMEQLNNI